MSYRANCLKNIQFASDLRRHDDDLTSVYSNGKFNVSYWSMSCCIQIISCYMYEGIIACPPIIHQWARVFKDNSIFALKCRQMGAKAWQFSCLSIACSTVYFERHQRNTKAPHHWSFCAGKPPLTCGFLHRGASNAESVSMQCSLDGIRPSQTGEILTYMLVFNNIPLYWERESSWKCLQ